MPSSYKKKNGGNNVAYIQQDSVFRDFDIAFTSNFVALALASEEGQFLDANKTFEEFSGYTRDELLKLTFFNLIRSDQLDESFNMVARLLVPEKNMDDTDLGSNYESINSTKMLVLEEDDMCCDTKESIHNKEKDQLKEFQEKQANSKNISTNQPIVVNEKIPETMDSFHFEQLQNGVAKLSFCAIPKSLAEFNHSIPGFKSAKDDFSSNGLQLTISVGPTTNKHSSVFYCSLTNQKLDKGAHKGNSEK